MKSVAIVGAGPTGIYTFYALFKNGTPLSVTLFEQGDEAGVGMPYNDEENSRMMLANIASIEIPPLFTTYLDWLRHQSDDLLARYHVDRDTLHVRQFLPRMLLGEYFRDRFLELVRQARQAGFHVEINEACRVNDVIALKDGVKIQTDTQIIPTRFDHAIIATGHVWPDDDHFPRHFFPSPWSGLMEAKIPACRTGIMGTSLSGIDAAMAVAAQHGAFREQQDGEIVFIPDEPGESLSITLMSRSGIFPEADFYCPIPWETLNVMTENAIQAEIDAGSSGLLDRVFALLVTELEQADPHWSAQIGLNTLNADTFRDVWFHTREKHNPFYWAEKNLNEVERNKREKRTVPWRYTVLRMHEAIQPVVPHLDDADRARFKSGLERVFIDNYAAIPAQSIRRVLALRNAGILHILALGEHYDMQIDNDKTVIDSQHGHTVFDVFIDARGQKALKIKDMPFPTLRETLLSTGDTFVDVADDYTLQAPESVRGRIGFGALPYLLHDRPFVQGLTMCAEIGEAMAKAVRGEE